MAKNILPVEHDNGPLTSARCATGDKTLLDNVKIYFKIELIVIIHSLIIIEKKKLISH